MKTLFLKYGVVATAAFIYSTPAAAVESCGGQSSSGNPKICCDAAGNSGGTYGNCVWWAWKKAYEAGWPKATIAGTGNAHQWDNNYAVPYPKLYKIITAPLNQSVNLKGAIAVRELSATDTRFGHVAYVEDVIKDASGNVTKLKISEMNCGTYGYGVIAKEYAVSKFDKYIKINDLNGKSASSIGCTDGTIVASSGTTNKLNLYWSNSCQTYWAGVSSAASGNKIVSVKRNWDGKSYSGSSSVAVTPITTAMVINSGTGQVCATGSVNGIPLPQVCK